MLFFPLLQIFSWLSPSRSDVETTFTPPIFLLLFFQITFHPGNSGGGTFTGDTKTAGSVALMLQAALPCLLLTGSNESHLILKGSTMFSVDDCLSLSGLASDVSHVERVGQQVYFTPFIGGTNADMAPQIDYFTMVMAPIVEKFGVKFEMNIVRRGYYPKGKGSIPCPETDPSLAHLHIAVFEAGRFL